VEALGEKLAPRPAGRSRRRNGEYVAGTYRQRFALASGRFAMIDDGLGFQLVPWSPSLESSSAARLRRRARRRRRRLELRPQARARPLVPIKKGHARNVRDQNPLGADPRRLPDRADHHLGRDAMDGLALGFQPQLGRPGSSSFGWPIYYPPAFFWWWYAYDAYAPPIFVEGAYIAASGGFIAIAVAIGMSVWRAREAKNVETYGSARWAEKDEVKSAGCSARWRRARPL
jgi:hypothetical protein